MKRVKSGSDGHSTDQHKTDRITRFRARTGHKNQRHVARDGRDRGHQHRTQTDAGSFRDGGDFVVTLLLQLVGELDNQDRIFRNQPDEGDQPDLRINIHRGRPAFREERHALAGHFQKGEDEGAEHGQRHGTEEYDQWIAEAVKLRREHEENQDDGEPERRQELVALHAELTRFARVINRVAFGKNLGRLVLEKSQGLIDWQCPTCH